MPRFINKYIYLLLAAAWLVTIAVIIDNYWSASASMKTVRNRLNQYVQTRENAFGQWLGDSSSIRSFMDGRYDEKSLETATGLPFFVFLFQKDSSGQFVLRFWNTQQVMPGAGLLFRESRAGFDLVQNGYFVWNTSDIPGGKALALIPVKWNYPVTNEYLVNRFESPGISNDYSLSPKPAGNQAVLSTHGQKLFYITRAGPGKAAGNNPVSAVLLIMAGFIVLVMIHLAASSVSATYGFWKGCLAFVLMAGGLRTLSYFVNIPLHFRQYSLFDPAVYGSNVLFPSLGDLLINAMMLVWFVLFIRFQLRERKISFSPEGPLRDGLITFLSALLILFSAFGGTAIISSLIVDSKISFDVVNFFTLNGYSIVGFAVLCCLAIGFYFLTQNIMFLIKPLLKGKFALFYLFTAVAGLVSLAVRMMVSESLDDLYFISLAWLILFLILINNRFLSLASAGFISSRLIFWIFFFCLSISVIIIRQNKMREIMIRKNYAELFAAKSDPGNESMLNTMLTDFRSATIWPRFHRFYDSLENRAVKDSLLNLNATFYKDKYETRVLTFSASGLPLYNSDSASFNELNSILQTEAKSTSKAGLFYFDESYEKFSYISRIDVSDPDSLLGYIFVIASPQRFKSDALYPELFSRGRTSAIENSRLYSIGNYKQGRLIESYNDYPFSTRLSDSFRVPGDFSLEEDPERNYSVLWFNAGAGRLVAIARESRQVLESITLFSYLFCSFLILMALFWIINGLARSGLKPEKMKELWQFNIRNQIHGTIILISVVSFLFIGLATFLFFRSRYERSNRYNLAKTAHIMERELKSYLSGDNGHIPSPEQSGDGMVGIINKLSDVHGIDINMYGMDGRIRNTSFPLPYTSGIISPLMDPSAYYHVKFLNEVQFFQKETICRLRYMSFYLPVMNPKGETYAYLQIPYFTSQFNLNQEISYFLITIINLNAFIFLIAGILALFITNRITGSFSMIAEKMKKVSLGATNEPIAWKRNDEIGALVNEYNRMVAKLDESATALAKSEREGAWKEMARQVAHEIKNPLTPMKLSLQYLQRSIDNNEPNVAQLTRDVSKTLIEQIDHLNAIANEFNQFAHIELTGKETFDLNPVLQNVLTLFKAEPNLKWNLHLTDGPLRILADRTHINRIFTNLIKNAIQAVPEARTPQITIREELRDGRIRISVSDNGEGIDEEVIPLIFTPNFTTKTSGSGLGLAICKRIAELNGGKIWFETQKGVGSTFFVEFPLTG